MVEQEFCKNCAQNSDCQKIYKKLGSTEAPSIVLKVIVAFLLPIVVFIASLAAFERILARMANSKELQTLLSFLMALLTTFICILIVRAIDKRLHQG